MARTVISKVLNNTRAKILGGTAVYQTGFDNDLGLITIAPASYESLGTMPAIGIVREDIEPNAEGVVTKTGLVGNINTSATSVNAPVFVGTGGALTFADPNDTNFDYYSQQLGTVTRISDDEGLVDLFPLEVRPKIKHDEILEVREEQHHDPVTAKNIGGGAQVFKQISAQAMTFRTIVAGEKIAITSYSDRIEIADNQLVDHIGQSAAAGQVAYWLDSDTITGEAGFYWDSDADTLRLDNYLALKESVAPSATSGYGKLFVKTTDSHLYFLDDSGVEYDLLAASTGTPDATFQSNKTFWNEAIYHLTIAADAYSASAGNSVPELTFQQNKTFWNEAIYHLRVAADGYAGGGGVSATQGSDGYVAFFTGSNSIAGDNDFFWDRVNEGLRIASSNLTVGGTVNAKMKILRTDSRVGLVIEGDANLQADMALKAPNNATDEKIAQILVNTDGTVAIRAVNDTFTTVTQNLFTGDLGSGSVGINNAAPDVGSKLHVVGELRLDGAGGQTLAMRDTSAAADGKEWKMQATGTTFVAFPVNDADSASGTVWLTVTRSANTVTNLAFATTTDITLTTAGTPRVYVGSGGNVGVGTTSPDQTLHVHKATAGTVSATANAVIVMENSGAGYLHMLVPDANEAGTLYGGPDNNIKSAIIFNPSSLIQFRSGGNTTRMTLSADGNLGIGPNSGTPHATLTVNGHIALEELTAVPPAVDGYGYIYVRTDDKLYYRSGTGTIFDLTAAAGVSASQGADGYITFFTGGTTLAGDNDFFYDRVNSRVGIGTSAPAVDLDVSTSREGNIQIRSVNLLAAAGANAVVGSATGGASGGDPILLMTVNGVTDWSVGIDNSDSDKLKIGSANTPGTSTYLTIDTTGNVGIGTESPDSKLDVSGSVDNVIRFDVENANTGTNASAGFRIIMTDASDSGNINFFQWGVNYSGTLAGISRQHASEISAFATSRMLIGTANTTAPIHFITNGIYAATISADQALGIGTQFPIEALTVNGTIALQELTANPVTQDGYGKLFVRDDNKLYYKDGLGVTFDLTTIGGGTLTATQGSDGYLAFFTGATTLAGDNDLFYDRVNSTLSVSVDTATMSGFGNTVGLAVRGQIVSVADKSDFWGFALTEVGTATSRTIIKYGSAGNVGDASLLTIGNRAANGAVAILTNTSTSGAGGETERMRISGGSETLVGIGTSSPIEALTINGTLALQELGVNPATQDGYGKLFVRDDDKLYFKNGLGSVFDLTAAAGVSASQGADGYVTFFTGATTIAGDNDFFFDRVNHNLTLMSNGKIGVGITSPTSPFHAQLEVEGTFYQAWTGGSARFDLASVNSPSNMAVLQTWNGLHILLRPQSGFVGINSSVATPANALDVSGAVSIGSAFYGSAAPTNGLRVEGLVAFGTATSPGTTALLINQSADDTHTIEGQSGSSTTFNITPRSAPSRLDISTSNLRTLILSPAGNGVGISTGTTNVANKLDVSGSVAIGSGYIGTFAGTNNLIVQGSIGIGTVSPYEALTVNGIIAMQEQDSTPDNVVDGYGRIYVKSDNKLYFQDGLGVETDLTTGGGTLTAAEGSDGYLAFFTSSTTLAGDNDLFWDRVGNRLGVGVTPTTHRLHVQSYDTNIALYQGLGSGGGTSKLAITASDSSGNYTATIDVGATATVFGHNTSSRDLVLQTNNTDRLTITGSAGLVGIGATPGTYRLTTHSADANIAMFQANNGSGTPRLVITGSDTSGNYSATIDVGALRVSFGHNVSSRDLVFQTNSTDAIYILGSNQNVGIGTSTPANKLDVEGAAVIGATYSGTNTAPTNGLLVEGTVGIGTVSPHEKLTLNGILSLQEQDAFDRTHDGYGSLWAKSDGTVHFTNDAGTDYNLTAAAGVSATQGSDGYVTFFTGATTLAGDNDFFWERVNNRLQLGGTPAILRKLSVLLDTETGDGIGITNTSTSAGGFAQLFLQSDVGFLLLDQFSGGYTGTTIAPGGTISQSNMGFIGTSTTSSGLIIHSAAGQNTHLGAGNTVFLHLTPEKNVGIGTVSPIEALTVNGVIALQELTANAATLDGYGKLFVRDDNKLYYKDGLGVTFDLTAAAGVTAAQGADGYVTFFTGANTIAGDNDFFYDRVNNRVGIGTSTPATKVEIMDGDHTYLRINSPLAFQASLAFADTTNGQDWVLYRVQGTTDLALHTSGIPGNLMYFTNVSADGYVLPGADVSHHLGNPTTRWESLYLGPSSLHFRTTAAETIETLDWTIGVGTNENKGDLLFYQSGHKNVRMKEEGGIIVTATKQYHGLSINNGINLAAQLIGFTANNDGGGLDLLTGGLTKVRLNADAAVPNYINHQGALGIGTDTPTTTSRLHIVVASGGGDVIRMSRDVSFDWDLGIASDSDLFIETGGGSRFVHIDAGTGNIGLGTSTPQNRLDIEGGAVIGTSFSGTNTSPTNGLLVEGKMAVGGPTSVSGTTAAIFRSSGSGHIVQLDRGGGYSYYLDIDGSGDFDLMDNDGTTSRIHVDTSTGNVGIGTITPSYKFTVAVSGSVYPEIITNTDSTIEVGWFLDASRGAFGSKTNHEFGLMAGDTVGITLKKIGTPVLVGIGTRFPIEILTVNGSIALQELDVNPATQDGYGKLFVRDDDKLYFKNGLGTVYDLTATAGVSASQGSDGYVTFFTGGTTLAGDNDFFWDRVNNRLGVGTTSPQVKVQFADEDSAGGVELYLQGLNATDTYADIAFINSTGDYMGDIGLDMIQSGEYYLNNLVDNIGHFKFWTRNSGNDTVKMFIGNTGRVGIGTEVPDAMLHVAGDGYFDGYLMPRTDNMWGLGTPALRWRDLYLGPESLHIISKTADSGRPNRDFRWTIDEAGILTLSEDSTTVATFSSAGVSFPVGGGSAAAPQYTISSVQTTGFTASFDTVYRCNPTGGGFTVTLPAASGGTGKTIIVKNVTSSTNTITIQGTGGELIDTQSSVEIVEGYASVTFVSYGSEWGRV